MTCIVDGCTGAKLVARGMCGKHYKRAYKYGDPLRENRTSRGLTLEQKLKRIGWEINEGGCWIWSGRRVRKGYGQLDYEGKNIYAHRAAFMTWRGLIPQGVKVLHTCDTPPCINPDHFFLGTDGDNARDRAAKGRGNQPRGIERHNAKLTNEEVIEIYDLRNNRGIELKVLAKEFDMSITAIWSIATGVTWGHLTQGGDANVG